MAQGTTGGHRGIVEHHNDEDSRKKAAADAQPNIPAAAVAMDTCQQS
ncbi:hypothetical protein PC116_g935 [Phytophthora cactorum]|nr:hypothetical protein Pcac1_g21904 [Phytophthora cactorum]KAG3192676.1 hypothetical protein C6341_g524 [Phytophthora cactorum]KAG4251388.1 hypothetical protein PC116_g935 [Phytophthora cactorum]